MKRFYGWRAVAEFICDTLPISLLNVRLAGSRDRGYRQPANMMAEKVPRNRLIDP
ncbi:hypothetical protein [Sphingomonas psychrotolerans]|uniref:hypothetical protein n=1 Tax=Sphingomonas psychrotolerans TaxID=1327635 RepID=UPI0013053CB5|nr:hypothetical protein [Sphingomonas psychrotolerans]